MATDSNDTSNATGKGSINVIPALYTGFLYSSL